MEKIVAVLGKGRREKIFRPDAIEKLKCMGDLVLNENQEDPQKEEVLKLAEDGTILITSWGCPQIDGELLDQMPDLKLIVHAAGSVKGVVCDEVWKRNIRVISSASQLGIGVAETALGFTIASMKNFWNLREDTRSGLWDEHVNQVNEIYQKKIGVFGAGWAGGHYIKLLSSFKVEVLLCDPYMPKEKADRMGVCLVDFEQLLKESDVVSIHAPSIPETFHVFNKDTLSMMKKDAILINTARGSLIDEEALFEHMKAGNLKYACLDVRDIEPPMANDKLKTLPNVILTPHIAGLANTGLVRIGDFVVNQIQSFLNNKECIGEVMQEKLKTMA